MSRREEIALCPVCGRQVNGSYHCATCGEKCHTRCLVGVRKKKGNGRTSKTYPVCVPCSEELPPDREVGTSWTGR